MPPLGLSERYSSSVRIWSAAEPVGTGFLIDERHIMTCAHVVADALGDRERFVDAECPTESVRFEFACERIRQIDDLHKAKPVPRSWRPQGSRAVPSDVAVLEIKEGTFLPPEARRVRICPQSYADDSFSAYAIKKGLTEGTYVEGAIKGHISADRTELLANRVEVAIAPGCSGAAVWNQSRGGVSGIVVEMHTDLQGRMIPIEALRQVWPELLGLQPSSDTPGADPGTIRLSSQLSAALHTFDREPQNTEFEFALDTHWEESNRPVLCAVLGTAEDRPVLYRDRCFRVSLRQRLERLEIGKEAAKKKIEWRDPVQHGVAFSLSRLVHQVKTELKAKDSSPAAIRKAYNDGVTPWAFFSLLQERDFTPLHRELITAWAHFWREVGAEKLNKPLAVLLLCQSSDTNGPTYLLDQIFKEFGTDALSHMHPLPQLSTFSRDDVKDWLTEKAGELGMHQADIDDRLVPELKKGLSENENHRLATLEAWIDRLSI